MKIRLCNHSGWSAVDIHDGRCPDCPPQATDARLLDTSHHKRRVERRMEDPEFRAAYEEHVIEMTICAQCDEPTPLDDADLVTFEDGESGYVCPKCGEERPGWHEGCRFGHHPDCDRPCESGRE